MVTTGDVAERKRPEERPSRLVVEYYGPGEEELVLRLRLSAVRRKEPVREWVLQAIRERLARLEPAGESDAREPPRGAEGRAADPQGE